MEDRGFPPSAAFKGRARAGANFDLSHDVDHINAPTLIIHGSDDRYVPVANATALAEAIPNSMLRVLDGAGHLVFIEQPERALAALERLLLRSRAPNPVAP